VDDVGHIARIGLNLLADRSAPRKGLRALEAYNRRAFRAWRQFLDA